MNPNDGLECQPRFNTDSDLFARKLDRPSFFPGRLSIPRCLSHPGSIDSLIDLSDLPLTRNAVSSLALFIKKPKRFLAPGRGQYILFLNVGVEDGSARWRFIDHSSLRTACDRERKNYQRYKLVPHTVFMTLKPLV
jgi:hypothetical protein